MGKARFDIEQWLRENSYTYQHGWKNFSHTQEQPAALVVDVDSVPELIRLMKQIHTIQSGFKEEDQLKVRAAAGWSDVTQEEVDISCCPAFNPFNFFFSQDVTPISLVQQAETIGYNESFSLSEVVSGARSPEPPLIIRFSPTFQGSMNLNESKQLNVPAGVKLRDSLDYLHERGLCLETGSMISEVTNIGLAATGGHGTGFKAPGFAELVEEFTLVDAYGDVVTINAQHIAKQRYNRNGRTVGAPVILKTILSSQGELSAAEVFQQMRGANLGLFGIITQAKFRTVPNYGVRETRTVYKNVKEIFADLNAETTFNGTEYDGFCAMGMVTDADKPMWEVRRWKDIPYAELKNLSKLPTYDAKNPDSFWQRLETELGSQVMQAMLDVDSGEILRKTFSRLAARFAIGSDTISDKEAKASYGEARKKEHYQVGFPKAVLLHDVSMITPVPETELKQVVPDVMNFAEQLARKYWQEGKTPVMFAFYLRILEGTNGGLSVTAHKSGEKILAFEFTTHPKAPGLAEFQKELVAYMEQRVGHNVRRHLGKASPVEGRTYLDIFPEETVQKFNNALDAFGNLKVSEENNHEPYNPFMTDYHAQMLGRKPMPKQEAVVKAKDKLDADSIAKLFAGAKEKLVNCAHHLIDDQGKQELHNFFDNFLQNQSSVLQV